MIWAFLLVLLGGLVVGGAIGNKLTSDACDAEKFLEQKRVEDVVVKKNTIIDNLADKLEKANATEVIRYKHTTKYIKEYVDRPVYRAECIDDDGLRAVNSIIAAKDYDPSKPKAAVRKGDTAGSKDGKGASGETGRAISPPK